MSSHPPYCIHHLNLHANCQLPQLPCQGQGNYLVFWWDNFALGDLYLEPGFSLTEEFYFTKLIEAIQPAIAQYSAGKTASENNWQQLLKNREMAKFHAFMQQLFGAQNAMEILEKVPVSVVICTRNRTPQLQRCLQMLLRLACRPEEIIVVDNVPSDENTRKLVAQFAEVQYVLEPRPGLDIARNTGVKTASQPIIAFTDDDVTVHPHWVFRVWETFQNPQISAMTGLVITAELETEAQFIFEKHWSFNRGYTDIFYDSNFFNSTLKQGPPVWEIGAGANMAFRRSVFGETGFFDELLDVGAAGCNGDSEMWYRLLKHGQTIHYNPRAIAFHEHRKEIAGLKKQLYYYMRGFTVAALLQQLQVQNAGYTRQLFRVLPSYYISLIRTGFPKYPYRYRTIMVEMLGILSGLAYYLKNRKQSKIWQ